MITVDRMTLRLPSSLLHRGEGIARLVGEALAGLPIIQGRRIRHLGVPPVAVGATDSDAGIAAAIAAAIHTGIARHSNTV